MGRERRRPDRHSRRLRDRVRAELRKRHLQRALQPAAVPGGLDRFAGVDVPSQPIYTDNSGPFGGVAGRRQDDSRAEACVTSTRTSRPRTRTLYGLSFQKEIGAGITGAVEYNGSTGRKLYDLADPNKIGAPFVYEGIGPGTELRRANTQYTAFNTRGNRGQSQYHSVDVLGRHS